MNVVSIAVKHNDVGGFFLLHISFFFCSHHFLFSPYEPLMKKGLHSLYLYFSLNIHLKCVKSFNILLRSVRTLRKESSHFQTYFL